MGEEKAAKCVYYVRLRSREVFPPDDPLVPLFLRLMVVVNDLQTLSRLWLFAESRAGKTRSEKAIIRAEYIYLFRLECAALYEAAIAFQECGKHLVKVGALDVIERMGSEAREAFHLLDNVFQEGFERKGWGNILVQMRNSIFHYPQPRVLRTSLAQLQEPGELISGEAVLVSKYLLADQLQEHIVARQLGVDADNSLKALMETKAALVAAFERLVDGWVTVQLQTHESAVIERDQDRVDAEYLWKIALPEGWGKQKSGR